MIQKIYQNFLLFSINEEDKTASVIDRISKTKDVLIPRSVKYQDRDFIVTSISKHAFSNDQFLTTIRFSPDSEVRFIGDSAFQNSKIKNIEIPKSVCELSNSLCNGTSELTRVTVDPANKCYKNDEKNPNLILGKSDKKSDNFDVLVFASRNIFDVTIPSSVKEIAKYAFDRTKIAYIEIPPSITAIRKKSFFLCRNLTNIKFSSDSNLQIIEELSIDCNQIKEIEIPASVIELKGGWWFGKLNNTKVTINKNNKYYKNDEKNPNLILGKSDKKSDDFDVLVCAWGNIKTVTIPSNVKQIAPFAFSSLDINDVVIPSNVTIIGKKAFDSCYNLRKFEIPNDSKLKRIEEYTFCGTKIESISIPESVCELCSGWSSVTRNLNNITIHPNNKDYKHYEKNPKIILGKSDKKSDEFDVLVFASRDIEAVTLPSNIKIIEANAFCCSNIKNIIIPKKVKILKEFSFYSCKKLEKIEFEKDSEIDEILEGSFCESSIKSISIPRHLKAISEGTFAYCSFLEKIIFEPESELRKIKESAFDSTQIRSISIPCHVIKIEKYAFEYTLQIIEFEENSELQLDYVNLNIYNGLIIMVPVKYKV